MSSLEVKENKFYVLTKEGREKTTTLHNDMESPIEKIREYMQSGIETEDIELMSVEMQGDEFRIKVLPWSIIAEKLIKKS